MKTLLKMTLEEIYLDYVNNFLSLEKMSEFYEVDFDTMMKVYIQARKIYRKVNQ